MKLNINDIIKNTIIFKKYPAILQAYVIEVFAIKLQPPEDASISILITYNKENIPTYYDIYYLEEELKEIFKRNVSIYTQNIDNKSIRISDDYLEKKIIYSIIS